MAIKKLEHVGVMVKDMQASIRFYTEVLGMEHTSTLVHNDENITLAFLSFPGAKQTEIELIEGFNPSLPAEGKVHHLAFTVDDVEQEVERLKQLNVPLMDTEITTLSNGSRYFFFYGPDGELLEFFQPGTK